MQTKSQVYQLPRLPLTSKQQEAVKSLTVIKSHRFLLDLGLQWAIIAAAIWIATTFDSFFSYAFAFIVIATRQHALGILMHDATHYAATKSRLLNDLVSDLFCALPINMITSRYRRDHLLHHRYVNSPKDPYVYLYQNDRDWHWPKSARSALGVAVRDLLAINLFKRAKLVSRWSPWKEHFKSEPKETSALNSRERWTVYVFYGALWTLLFLTESWGIFLLLWVLPMVTLAAFISRIGAVSEHAAIPPTKDAFRSRNCTPTVAERLVLAPLNIDYHADHHFFPAVPYYNLPRLREILATNPVYASQVYLTGGYFLGSNNVLGDLLAKNLD